MNMKEFKRQWRQLDEPEKYSLMTVAAIAVNIIGLSLLLAGALIKYLIS